MGIIFYIVQDSPCTIPAERIQLFADGKEVPMDNKELTLEELPEIPHLINIGRKRKYKLESTHKLEDECETLHTCLDVVRECPRARCYSGHVPGHLFGYGLPENRLDNSHLQPTEDVEKAKHNHLEDPCLGYQGHLRGKQHVGGRTWNSVVKESLEHEFDELVLNPSIPHQIPNRRVTTLEPKDKPEMLKLLTPPQSPTNKY